MPFDRFLIAPIRSGMKKNREPWLLPNDAFELMRNAYIYRDRIVKRFGGNLLRPRNLINDPNLRHLQSRLRIKVGELQAGNHLDGVAPGNIFKIGQMFSVGTTVFTVYQDADIEMHANRGGTGDFDTGTGLFDITAPQEDVGTDVYFYPCLPVMGLPEYIQAQINQPTHCAFDTRFFYRWTDDGWDSDPTTTWSGESFNLFWTINYRTNTAVTGAPAGNYLITTNNHDVLRRFDGNNWTDMTPTLFGSTDLDTAKIVIEFKNRLLILNTVEGGNRRPNRCRFSVVGNGLHPDAFNEDLELGAGFTDAPTSEQIVSAAFIKDRLIVYFEGSTWEIVYNNNDLIPFLWQKIDSELGVESTFSSVLFDDHVFGIGEVGIHSCDGRAVRRIDQDIPDLVRRIHNENQSLDRVYGIRDFTAELSYWAYPDDTRTDDNPFNNKLLVYNYRDGGWAIFDDSVTALGYFQSSVSKRWSDMNMQWQENDNQWNSHTHVAYKKRVIAGNQQGYTWVVDHELGRNSQALYISDIQLLGGNPRDVSLRIQDHNLEVGDHIYIENIFNNHELNGQILEVYNVDDEHTVHCVTSVDVTVDYIGGGTATRVSEVEMITKQYNFYVNKMQNVFLQRIEFFVDKTNSGQLLVSFMADESNEELDNSAQITNSSLGEYTLDMFPYNIYQNEIFQKKLWRPVYTQVDGFMFQFKLHYEEFDMMFNPAIVLSPFRIHAMAFYVRPSSRLGG